LQTGDDHLALDGRTARGGLELALQPREFEGLQILNVVEGQRRHGDVGVAGAVEADLGDPHHGFLVTVQRLQFASPVAAFWVQGLPDHRTCQGHRHARHTPACQRYWTVIDFLSGREGQIRHGRRIAGFSHEQLVVRRSFGDQ